MKIVPISFARVFSYRELILLTCEEVSQVVRQNIKCNLYGGWDSCAFTIRSSVYYSGTSNNAICKAFFYLEFWLISLKICLVLYHVMFSKYQNLSHDNFCSLYIHLLQPKKVYYKFVMIIKD